MTTMTSIEVTLDEVRSAGQVDDVQIDPAAGAVGLMDRFLGENGRRVSDPAQR